MEKQKLIPQETVEASYHGRFGMKIVNDMGLSYGTVMEPQGQNGLLDVDDE
jgi:tetrahydromethanopterin S-methyltransferase subunit G